MKRHMLVILMLLIGMGTWYYIIGSAPTIKKVPTSSFTGQYPGLHLTVESEQAKAYTTAISLPRTDYEVLNDELDAFILEKKEAFQHNLTPNHGQKGHLNIQTDTYQTNQTEYTLVAYTYAFTGGANGQTNVDVFRLNLSDGTFIEWDDVLRDDQHVLEWFQSSVITQLQNQEYVFEDQLREAIKHPKSTKWILTSSGLVVMFDEYEVTAGAAGVVEVHIPMKEVEPFLLSKLNASAAQEEDSPIMSPSNKPLEPNGKYVALTFDDGPHPVVTPNILEALEKYQARATFFMLGSQMEFYPDVAKQVALSGHELANHTEHHPDLTQLSEKGMEVELKQVDERIERLTGGRSALVRPPYGAKNEMIEQILKTREQTLALWTVDSLDWSHRNADQMYRLIMDNVHPNAVVLMHDIHESTAEGLPKVLDALKREGYTFVTMSELLTLE
ncbi:MULTISPECIES: polysaccharide deacetylase family protein [unclassified Exiguobacterium]|uniref:polysaccharide deacetylase family protein n=1 Tax=unclassified Exiguobacterium TaxID=2644629 RepID=UPI001BE8D6A4|nr:MULTISPECIES: polysaccharide deacetylase family protein [unclassified Exiguobacterium]